MRGDLRPVLGLEPPDGLQLAIDGAGRRRGEVRQPHHPAPHDGVERAIDQDADPFRRRELEHGAARRGRRGRRVVRLEDAARLEEVQRELEDSEVVAGAAGLLGGGQHPGETGRLGVVRRRAPRCSTTRRTTRASPPPRAPRRSGRPRRDGDRTRPGPLRVSPVVVGRVGEEVLGVVEQADVERLEAQALERPRQLVLEELRVHAVPAVRLVVHHLGERAAGGLALLGQGEVLPLHVADLRDDDDLLARDAPPPDRVAEDAPHQPLAAAVGVVRRGVDEVHAARQRPLERAPVHGGLVVDAVAAEAETAHRQAGAAERP